MTVSMRVMSAGDGYRYLLRTVAAGDGTRGMTTPLTRYYQEKGTPPGRWLGSGLPGLANRAIRAGDEVTESELTLFLGYGRDPITAEQLGRPYGQFKTAEQRVAARVAKLPAGLPGDEREASIDLIRAEEAARSQRRAVAGFDFTFSVPKSVSTLWAVADAGTQAVIANAHFAALRDVLAMMEQDVVMTRVGFNGRGGAVAQVETRGVIATAFDHYDSRATDPQLHTHVVIGNKVQGLDGKWRAPDGRPLHAAVVALSEMYNAILADWITAATGLDWEARARGKDRSPAWELTGVPEDLISEFSSRSHDINEESARLIDQYRTAHGRQPSRVTIVRLRQQATLSSRPKKNVRSLAELTGLWRHRAGRVLGEDATTWATALVKDAAPVRPLRADDISLDHVRTLADYVVTTVGTKRSTWHRWNLTAEAARATMGYRFATIEDRHAAVGLVVDEAQRISLQLTPPELATSPTAFQHSDGTSAFRPKSSTVYSSQRILDAEDDLLALASTTTGPTIPLHTIERAAATPDARGLVLGPDQRDALIQISSSGRIVDVLVGPAGAGKTTTLGVLRRSWESHHGANTVVGLAPSSSAADVLADDIGIVTENTTKWLYEHHRIPDRMHEATITETRLRELTDDHQTGSGLSQAERHRQIAWLRARRDSLQEEIHRWQLHPGQLLIVDEASLAGTLSLHELALHAAEAGAKVLLVGDWAQLTAIDSGGALGLLARDRPDTPELTALHRFRNEWERAASLSLRLGDDDVIDTYREQGRIVPAGQEHVLDAAYRAWQADRTAGTSTVLIAETLEIVTQLNLRARLDLINTNQVEADGATLRDGNLAGRGDTIITRKNDRRLTTGASWVKNGDIWTITSRSRDGSLTVRRAHSGDRRRIVLPAPYVAEHVDLGYAITTHRVQGMTVDRAHAVIQSASMTREALYVALTRGRDTNIAYVATDEADLEDHLKLGQDITARMVLTGILHHTGAELSAHEQTTAEHETWSNITQLAAEYETIAQTAQRDRWLTLLEHSGLTEEQVDQIVEADTFGPLTVELRRAEANGHNPAAITRNTVGSRDWQGVDDIASVLRWRIQQATTGSRPRNAGPAHLIAGLIPQAQGIQERQMQRALSEREGLIEQRARTLAETAISDSSAWASDLGPAPAEPARREAWLRSLTTVAAYRDRYNVTTASPLGPAGTGDSIRRIDRQRAESALRTARTLAPSEPTTSDQPGFGRETPDLSR